LTDVAGAGIVDHVRPASRVWAIVPQMEDPHASIPRTQPSLGDANVTDNALKPAGTARLDGDGEAESVAEGRAEAVGDATAVGGALGLEIAVAADVAVGGTDWVAAGLPSGVAGDADGTGAVDGLASPDGLGDGVAVGEAPQPATSMASTSATEGRVVLMALGRLRVTMCSSNGLTCRRSLPPCGRMGSVFSARTSERRQVAPIASSHATARWAVTPGCPVVSSVRRRLRCQRSE